MKLKIHPLFFLCGIAAALTGQLLSFFSVALAAMLHEGGHSFCAARAGYRLNAVRLMPYGAVVSGEPIDLPPKEEILLCLAGPLVNGLVVLFFVALWWFFPETYPYTDTAVYASASVGLCNLLPLYPLDGGRILFCLLPPKGKRVHRGVSCAIALGLCFAAVLLCAMPLLLFGAFVAVGACSEGGAYEKINFSAVRGLSRGLRLKQVAVGSEMPLRRAFRFLDRTSYLILYVYDAGERLLGTVDQAQLYALFERCGSFVPIGKFFENGGGNAAKVLSLRG